MEEYIKNEYDALWVEVVAASPDRHGDWRNWRYEIRFEDGNGVWCGTFEVGQSYDDFHDKLKRC